MKKIVSVILNYKNYKETIECVDSIKRQDYLKQEIIIVENGSQNESLEILKQKYSNDKNVFIIESKNNIGFAKGNNLGIKFALDNFNPDAIFVVNSDCICSKQLFMNVEQHLNDTTIGVINPYVLNLNGEEQIPAIYTNNVYKFIDKTVYKMKRALVTTLPGIYLFNRLFITLRNNVFSKNNRKNIIAFSNYKYVIQGCSFFLTKSFISKYTCLYPNTFLYFEEINLAVYLEKAELKSIVLQKDASVIHKEAGSSFIYKNNFRKKLKQNILSYKNSKDMYKMSYEQIIQTYK